MLKPRKKNFYTENCLPEAFADPRKQIKIHSPHSYANFNYKFGDNIVREGKVRI